ncbi:MAG: nitric oxide reductase NorE protein [Sulfurimonas sp.]|jgi:nitric oxide reductase NorE protein|uniref:cytochrome c oxidase subunit 3 n=1 Tax=Sulfurimonas sp. TaxID=2022749 RepID=UPI0039E64F4A
MAKTLKYNLPPGDFGIWLVVYMEFITFGLLFIGYAFSRRVEIDIFNQSQLLLDQRFGFINTIILLTSSYFVVKAIEAIKNFDIEVASKKASISLQVAMSLGALFLIIKIIEISDKYSQGINLSTNTFFMFYIILIVFHFMHVLLGMVILFNIQQKTKLGGYTKMDYEGMRTGAIYWHLVDLLWIVLFPLLYIMS